MELQTGIDKLLGCLTKDVCEYRTIVNDVQINPIALSANPNLQVFVHGLQLLDPSNNVTLNVSSELTLRDDLERIKILLNGLIQRLSVDHDVRVGGILERNYLEIELLPLLTDAFEYSLILSLCVSMLNDMVNILFVILNVVLLQVYNCKLVLRFQVRGFDQVEDLHPVSIVQAVLPKVFNKLNNDVCLVHLLVDRLADLLTFPLDELVLR